MNSRFSKVLGFAGKSLLWAAGLYAVCLVTLYKDELANVASNAGHWRANIQSHLLPQANDTTISLPSLPRTGVFMSARGIKSIEVSVDGLLRIVNLLRK